MYAADDPDNIFLKIIEGKVPCYKARGDGVPCLFSFFTEKLFACPFCAFRSQRDPLTSDARIGACRSLQDAAKNRSSKGGTSECLVGRRRL